MPCRHGGAQYTLTLTEIDPQGRLAATIEGCVACRALIYQTFCEAIRRAKAGDPAVSRRRRSPRRSST
jgi:hypothetical protein